MRDNFTNITLSVKTLDIYFIRCSIFKAIKLSLPQLNGKLLDIGCGKMPYKSFVMANSSVTHYMGLDLESAIVYDEEVKPDYTWDGVTMPFEDSAFDCAFGTEVLEHCFEPKVILNEIYRILKPDGTFFFTIPFLWNLHEVPNDAYRYTPFALQKKLAESGFKGIHIQAYGGWHSSMAQMLGLWVRRSPMNELWRNILSFILWPVIRFLIYKDKHLFGHSQFNTAIMIPGLFGICHK